MEKAHDLKLNNNHIPVFFLVTSFNWPLPHPQYHSFICSWNSYLWQSRAILQSYSVLLGISYVYRKYTCYYISVSYFFFFSLVNLINAMMSQPRIYKCRRKIIFLPYMTAQDQRPWKTGKNCRVSAFQELFDHHRCPNNLSA